MNRYGRFSRNMSHPPCVGRIGHNAGGANLRGVRQRISVSSVRSVLQTLISYFSSHRLTVSCGETFLLNADCAPNAARCLDRRRSGRLGQKASGTVINRHNRKGGAEDVARESRRNTATARTCLAVVGPIFDHRSVPRRAPTWPTGPSPCGLRRCVMNRYGRFSRNMSHPPCNPRMGLQGPFRAAREGGLAACRRFPDL